MRSVTWEDDRVTNIAQQLITNRGFTGHEHIEEVGLIHMNGRVYEQELGRFLSADPFVQSPFMTNSFNRYSYVMNNPLKYTDPTGFFYHENGGKNYNERVGGTKVSSSNYGGEALSDGDKDNSGNMSTASSKKIVSGYIVANLATPEERDDAIQGFMNFAVPVNEIKSQAVGAYNALGANTDTQEKIKAVTAFGVSVIGSMVFGKLKNIFGKFFDKMPKSFGNKEIKDIAPRVADHPTRLGGKVGDISLKVSFTDGTKIDISPTRVKETKIDKMNPKGISNVKYDKEIAIDKSRRKRALNDDERSWYNATLKKK